MILGRPVNLVLGAVTAIFNLIVLVLAALVPPVVIPAVVVGAANLAIAALITLVAGQPPTITSGDTVKVETPAGAPNRSVTVD
jgi:hypothetical protein